MNDHVPKPKKTVSRSVALALGIICIVLIAGIGGVMAYYTVYNTNGNRHYTDADYNALQNLYNSEVQQYNTYIADHHNTDEEYNTAVSNYNNEVNTYNNYVSDHSHTDEDYNSVNNIASLNDSAVWVNDQTISQPSSSFTVWTVSADYAGYVSVWVQSSTVPGTHVKVIYSAKGVDFNQELVIGYGQTANFPLLPSSNIQVEVGNALFGGNGATETVTITYYY
jgi:hypothetical protein